MASNHTAGKKQHKNATDNLSMERAAKMRARVRALLAGDKKVRHDQLCSDQVIRAILPNPKASLELLRMTLNSLVNNKQVSFHNSNGTVYYRLIKAKTQTTSKREKPFTTFTILINDFDRLKREGNARIPVPGEAVVLYVTAISIKEVKDESTLL